MSARVQIIIEVHGGVVQDVYTNAPDPAAVECTVVDYDNAGVEKMQLPPGASWDRDGTLRYDRSFTAIPTE